MQPYSPNFNDPRIQRRLRQVLGWCRFNLSPDVEHAWHVSALEKVFGTGSNPLSAYLRGKLLIQCRQMYAYRTAAGKLHVRGGSYAEFFDRVGDESEFLDAGSCKTYRRNQENYLWLLQQVKIPQAISPTHSKHGSISPIQVPLDTQLGVELVLERHGEQITTGRFSYNETKSGRLTHPLQQIIRHNKPDLWRQLGYTFDYDIVTCAPTLLLQYARRSGFKKSTPEYDTYLLDRRAYRNSLAEVLNVTPEVSKVLITALFNGARLSINQREALMKQLNKEVKKGNLSRRPGDVIRQLQQVEFISRLRRDISSLWRFLRENDYPKQPSIPIRRKKILQPTSPTHSKHGSISPIQVPEGDIWYHRKKSLTGSQRWAIYLRLERQVLNAVRPVLEFKGRVFFEHDGWRTDFDIRTDVLSHVIHQQTGYSVIIEKEAL